SLNPPNPAAPIPTKDEGSISWADYLQLMRDGIAEHGPVRAGVYAMTGYEGVDSHAAGLGQQSRAVHGIGSPGEAGIRP
ncbi:MAG: hypothetical protein OXH86_01420, partial [Acidimicrobiaceae bacterium]|nr:hypothetical protein [Acidimicrobiaceae bacterium]